MPSRLGGITNRMGNAFTWIKTTRVVTKAGSLVSGVTGVLLYPVKALLRHPVRGIEWASRTPIRTGIAAGVLVATWYGTKPVNDIIASLLWNRHERLFRPDNVDSDGEGEG